MAKSLRSKVKRSFRTKKRETGIYAATAAARLNRLNSKLIATARRDKDGDMPVEDLEGEDIPEDKDTADTTGRTDQMDLDEVATAEKSQRISTHGPRGSRNEEWRKSKGMAARPTSRGMNRQGGIAAKRKAGRSSRRR